jgi:hypothetical protein
MIFNFKRAQSLSLNTIIIAALALIVLVVMIFIFSGKIKIFGQGTESCANQGGQCTSVVYTQGCIEAGTCKCPDTITNAVVIRSQDCEKQARICCKSLF